MFGLLICSNTYRWDVGCHNNRDVFILIRVRDACRVPVITNGCESLQTYAANMYVSDSLSTVSGASKTSGSKAAGAISGAPAQITTAGSNRFSHTAMNVRQGSIAVSRHTRCLVVHVAHWRDFCCCMLQCDVTPGRVKKTNAFCRFDLSVPDMSLQRQHDPGL